ncbi:glutaminyl-peptide cyclotransferase, partial [Yersinia pestis]
INPNDLKIIKTFNYEGEGWGLTTDGINLIMGDGSDTLYFRNPADFSIIKKISVTFDGRRIEKINELEWIDGMIYANVWYSDAILVIEPENGRVVKWIELSGLQFMLDSVNRNTNTLNGIAYDKSKNKIYLTGKNWSNIFEVKFLTSK